MERMPIELAEKIVDMLHNVTHDNVNFIGENGKIIASIQTNRIGSIHEGGKRIMAGEIDELAITSEAAAELQSSALQNISESVMEIQIETDNLTRAVV